MAYATKQQSELTMVDKFTATISSGTTNLSLKWTYSQSSLIELFAYGIYIVASNTIPTDFDNLPADYVHTNLSQNSITLDLEDYGYNYGSFYIIIRPFVFYKTYDSNGEIKTQITIKGKPSITHVNNTGLSNNAETTPEAPKIYNPTGITSDTEGNIYTLNGFSESTSGTRIITKVNTDGTLVNFNNPTFTDDDNRPNAQLDFKDNNLFYHYSNKIYKINLDTPAEQTTYSTYWNQDVPGLPIDGMVTITDDPNIVYYLGQRYIGTYGSSQLKEHRREVWGFFKKDLTKTGLNFTFDFTNDMTVSLLNTFNVGTTGNFVHDVLVSNISDTSSLEVGQIVKKYSTDRLLALFNYTDAEAIIIDKTSSSVTLRTYVWNSYTDDWSSSVILDRFNTDWTVSNDILVCGSFKEAIVFDTDRDNFYNANIPYNYLWSVKYKNGFLYALSNQGFSYDSGSVSALIKVNVSTNAVTTITDALTSSSVIDGGWIGNSLTFVGDDIYVSGGSRILKVTESGTVTVIAGGDAVGVPTDGTGSAAKFANARHITYNSKDGYLYVSDTGTVSGTQYGMIRTVSLDGVVGPKQSTDETNVNDGNGDISAPGGDFGIGNGGYVANIPPAPGSGTDGTVSIENPEEENIAIIPIPGGWGPDDVWTWRKDGDKLYLLLNGIIVWSYILSPVEVFVFPSNGYRGFYQRETRISIFPPIGGIIQGPPLNGYRYVFNTEINQPGLGWGPLFERGVNKASQALLVLVDNNDNAYISIEERPIDEDVRRAAFVALGGRNYVIDENGTIAPSPVLPYYVLQLIANSPYYVYLVEVP